MTYVYKPGKRALKNACEFQESGRFWAELAVTYRDRGVFPLVAMCQRHAASCYASAREIMRIEE